eukprot:144475_1
MAMFGIVSKVIKNIRSLGKQSKHKKINVYTIKIIEDIDWEIVKNMLIYGYIRINIENKYNLFQIPDEIKLLIQHKYPTLIHNNINLLISGYLRQTMLYLKKKKRKYLIDNIPYPSVIMRCCSLYYSETVSHSVDIFYHKPIRHVIHTLSGITINDITAQISQIYNVKEAQCILCQLNKSNTRIMESYKSFDYLVSGKHFVCYITKDWWNEMSSKEIKQNNLRLTPCKICHSCPKAINRREILIGKPFLITHIIPITNRKLYQHIYERLYEWIGDEILAKPPYLKIVKLYKMQKTKTIKKKENIGLYKYEMKWDEILLNDLPFKLRKFQRHVELSECEIIPINNMVYIFRWGYSDVVIEWNENIYCKIQKIICRILFDNEYKIWIKQQKNEERERLKALKKSFALWVGDEIDCRFNRNMEYKMVRIIQNKIGCKGVEKVMVYDESKLLYQWIKINKHTLCGCYGRCTKGKHVIAKAKAQSAKCNF